MAKIKFKNKPWQIKRKLIYERDKYQCVYCGKKAIDIPENYQGETALRTGDGGQLELDHIISRKKGGSNSINNLQTLCSNCNSSKGCK